MPLLLHSGPLHTDICNEIWMIPKFPLGKLLILHRESLPSSALGCPSCTPSTGGYCICDGCNFRCSTFHVESVLFWFTVSFTAKSWNRKDKYNDTKMCKFSQKCPLILKLVSRNIHTQKSTSPLWLSLSPTSIVEISIGLSKALRPLYVQNSQTRWPKATLQE